MSIKDQPIHITAMSVELCHHFLCVFDVGDAVPLPLEVKQWSFGLNWKINVGCEDRMTLQLIIHSLLHKQIRRQHK